MDRVGDVTSNNLDKYLLEFLCSLPNVFDVHVVLAAFAFLIACILSFAPPLHLPVAPYLLFLLLGQAVLRCLLRRQHDIGVDGGADQLVVRLGGLPFPRDDSPLL